MVVVSILSNPEIERNGHRENAPNFITLINFLKEKTYEGILFIPEKAVEDVYHAFKTAFLYGFRT